MTGRYTSDSGVISGAGTAEDLTGRAGYRRHFGKNHKHVLRHIRQLLESDEDGFGTLNFEVSSYLSEQNKEMPMYVT